MEEIKFKELKVSDVPDINDNILDDIFGTEKTIVSWWTKIM
jgi:hypothetical protein